MQIYVVFAYYCPLFGFLLFRMHSTIGLEVPDYSLKGWVDEIYIAEEKDELFLCLSCYQYLLRCMCAHMFVQTFRIQ